MKESAFTTVVGVDGKHLNQLSFSWPTWKRHKPALLKRPMLIFHDYRQVLESQVRKVVDHPNLKVVPWPNPLFQDEEFKGNDSDKWTNRQRNRMLCGFIHIPAQFVETPYWLKLDTDVVAVGRDNWINPEWFAKQPVIVAHPWKFTKPPDQMLWLDDWVRQNADHLPFLAGTNPLNLFPKKGSQRLGHRRIISWCGFFGTNFTRVCAAAASVTCQPNHLPVPSQDGFSWYMATRLGQLVQPVNLKCRGWQHWGTQANVEKYSALAMEMEKNS